MRLIEWLATAIASFCLVMALVALVAISYEVLVIGKARDELVVWGMAMFMCGLITGAYVALRDI